MKHHVKSLQKGPKADKYMVQNLTCSGVYLGGNLLSALIQKILKLVPLTETETEVYVTTSTTVLSDYYDYLVENLNQMTSLKLKDHLEDNVADWRDAIVVYYGRLESAGVFKTDHLVYIVHIFEDNYDSRLHLRATQKYKEVVEFIKKLCVCDKYDIQTNDIINYGSHI